MSELRRVTLGGDAEGDYVVLAERGGGRLMIAPERPDGLPRLVALKRTTWACPTQWEGELEDGRTLYARSRHGELSVGIGAGLDAAVANGMSKDALCHDLVEEAPMSFEELRAHLHGLLELPEGLRPKARVNPVGTSRHSRGYSPPGRARAEIRPGRTLVGVKELLERPSASARGFARRRSETGPASHAATRSPRRTRATTSTPIPTPSALIRSPSRRRSSQRPPQRGSGPRPTDAAHGRRD